MIEWTIVLAATAFALVCIRKAQLAARREPYSEMKREAPLLNRDRN